MRHPTPKSSFESAPSSTKRGENSQDLFGHNVCSGVEMKERDSSKLDERRGNVHENKGPLWKTRQQSGNDTENKGSYALKAGMLLKRKG
jgi:hypothetical protein